MFFFALRQMNSTTFFDERFAYILSSGLSKAQREQLIADGWTYISNPKTANEHVRSHRCYRKARTNISAARSDVATQTSAPPEPADYVSEHDEFDMYDQFWS